MELYHGTDYSHALSVQKDGFVIRPSIEHWLGNGVYFYMDESLAKWWTSKPSKKFGVGITQPALIVCEVDVEHLSVLDLRNLSDYFFFCDSWKNEFWPLYEKRAGSKPVDYRRVRCAYCDYLKALYEYDAIIGTFHLPNQPYLSKDMGSLGSLLKLEYTEVQVCVFDSKHITVNRIEKV